MRVYSTIISASIVVLSFLFAGCGEKPIVVRAKQKPVIQNYPPSQTVQKEVIDNKYPPTLNPTTIGEKVVIKTNATALGTPVGDINQSEELGEVVTTNEEILDASTSDSYVATFKTKKFAYSDAAFIRDEGGVLELQILTAGKPLLHLKIAEDVCVDHNCITKMEFNDEYLNHNYPPNLIDHVLRGEPIFDGKNLKKTTNGFMQKIETPDFFIKYKTYNRNIYFKDVKNNIVIKLRKLSQ